METTTKPKKISKTETIKALIAMKQKQMQDAHNEAIEKKNKIIEQLVDFGFKDFMFNNGALETRHVDLGYMRDSGRAEGIEIKIVLPDEKWGMIPENLRALITEYHSIEVPRSHMWRSELREFKTQLEEELSEGTAKRNSLKALSSEQMIESPETKAALEMILKTL